MSARSTLIERGILLRDARFYSSGSDLIIRFLVIAFLVAFTSTALVADDLPQEQFLETLPARARGSFTVRNFARQDEGNAKLQEAVGRPNKFRLKQLATMGLSMLKIHQGVNWDGNFSAVVMDWGDHELNEKSFQFLVLRIPFSDAGLMAGNFQLQKDDLVEGKIHHLEKHLGGNPPLFLTRKGESILLSPKEEAIAQYLKSPPLKSVVQSDPDNRLSQADLLFHISAKGVWDEDGMESILKEMGEQFADQPVELRKQITQIIKHTDHLFGAARFDNGLNFRIQFALSPDLPPESQKLLTAWGQQADAPHLRGFPEGKMVFGMSKAASGFSHPQLLQRFSTWMVRQFVQNNSISQLVLPYLDPQSDTLHGVTDEIWNSTIETRSAVYLNENLKEDGLANMVVILKPAEKESFTQQLASLVKFSRGAVYDPKTNKVVKVSQEEIAQLIQNLGSDQFR